MRGVVVESLKVVYWPIPKNASTAILTRIAEIEGLTYDLVHDAPFKTCDYPLDGYHNFTIVRHPLHRLYSLWKNKLADGHPGHKNYDETGVDRKVFGGPNGCLFYSGMPFDEFVNVACCLIPVGQADPHWSPQHYYVHPGVEVVNMERITGLLRLAFPLLNVSDSTDWEKAYAPSALRKVLDYYTHDFSNFGYPSLDLYLRAYGGEYLFD